MDVLLLDEILSWLNDSGLYATTYNSDGTVTVWNIYTQSWVRTDAPSEATLASLSPREREQVMRHVGMHDGRPVIIRGWVDC